MDVARLLGGANLQCVRGHVEDQGVFLALCLKISGLLQTRFASNSITLGFFMATIIKVSTSVRELAYARGERELECFRRHSVY